MKTLLPLSALLTGCTVWTMDELRKLIGMAMRKGYEAGKKSL